MQRWQTRFSAEALADFTRNGRWSDTTLLDNALVAVEQFGNETAVVDDAGARTFAEIFQEASRVSSRFREMDLAPGDVISFQLPNWSEALAINLAANMCGLVVNPIVPIYREAEVEYILKSSRTRILFIPDVFRSINYISMIDKLRSSLPDLRKVITVRGDVAKGGYEKYETWSCAESYTHTNPVPTTNRLKPNDIKLLLYTSGTTGRPKGVLHSDNTIQAEINAVVDFWSLTRDDIVLMASPITHITGYIYGMEMMPVVGCKTVYMEKWSADHAADLIAEHGVTFSIGATPFLSELVSALEVRQEVLTSLRLFACGGAPVAPEVIRRAKAVLPNCLVFRVYGSSEAPTVTAGVARGHSAELGATTDGCILNYDVKIVHPVSGETVPDGAEGEIVVRGPELMLGYTEWEDTLDAFDENGYFRTGDLGFLTNGNYLTISGRKKDLIIRGGENISAKEVEDVLHNHPAVAEAAVVAMPHERMGETPAAFIVLRKGMTMSFEEMANFLDHSRLARQKIPERLFELEEMPKTASGKILKHVLRARCRAQLIRK